MEKGKLIVFEGACDGIGKSTQIGLLRKRMEQDGDIIVSHHFPTYNTYHGAPVEEYLAGNLGDINELSPYFINSLYAVDRACAWHTKLKQLYEEGNILLTDYTDPEWVPVMLKASAIITAEGGILSHTAIISRELGIPCVTGLGYKAIEELSKSDMIEVNGSTGKVKTLQISKRK